MDAAVDAALVDAPACPPAARPIFDADVPLDAEAPTGGVYDARPPADDPHPDAGPVDRPRVVVMSIDGLRPDAIEVAPAKNLLAFAKANTTARAARTIEFSFTLPSHSSMLSGWPLGELGPDGVETIPGHHITWNDPASFQFFIKVPTIFQIARGAGLRPVMVVGKEKFQALWNPGALAEFTVALNDDDGVAARVLQIFEKADFDVMFIHFPNPDLTGHAYGWMSPEYLEKVVHVDGLFGRLLAALPKGATLIVTADHGGQFYGHGSVDDVDRLIPWMIGGPRIKKRHVVMQPVITMDTAATALHVVGLPLGGGATGKVVEDAFAF